MHNPPIRVLIVDDSAFMRFAIAKRLNAAPGIHVVGSARDGENALEMIPKVNPDVITLDVEMPRMDGLTTLRNIMATNPRPVIMLSSLTEEGARETIQALTWGAVDFIKKPDNKANIDFIIADVVAKIKKAAQARVYRIPLARRAQPRAPKPPTTPARPYQKASKVVVIGASTGGPRALSEVVANLPADLPAALLIVQHMPVGFTRSLAERLDNLSSLPIKEAAPGDRLGVGRGLLAPGGFHMTIDETGAIAANQNPPVHGVRPSVDVTMASVAQRYGRAAVAVILTGMGRDGAHGATLIQSAGGHVIAEHESTCVVWGMPRSVVEAKAADEVLPLHEIAAAIDKAVRAPAHPPYQAPKRPALQR